MSDLLRGQGGRVATRYPAAHDAATDHRWGSPAGGRHAFDEDAVLTPIFHALTRGGWRSRQHDSATVHAARQVAFGRDPVDAFRRDPLTAPIPVQALVPATVHPAPLAAAHALSESERDRQGRHHRRREPVGSPR